MSNKNNHATKVAKAATMAKKKTLRKKKGIVVRMLEHTPGHDLAWAPATREKKQFHGGEATASCCGLGGLCGRGPKLAKPGERPDDPVLSPQST